MKNREKIIELNARGNFDNWEPQKLTQLKESRITTDIGQLRYEDSLVKYWDIVLPPYERLPFRLIKRSLTITSIVKGTLISRYSCGQIDLWLIEKGHSYKCLAEAADLIFEIENMGKTDLQFKVIEHLGST